MGVRNPIVVYHTAAHFYQRALTHLSEGYKISYSISDMLILRSILFCFQSEAKTFLPPDGAQTEDGSGIAVSGKIAVNRTPFSVFSIL